MVTGQGTQKSVLRQQLSENRGSGSGSGTIFDSPEGTYRDTGGIGSFLDCIEPP